VTFDDIRGRSILVSRGLGFARLHQPRISCSPSKLEPGGYGANARPRAPAGSSTVGPEAASNAGPPLAPAPFCGPPHRRRGPACCARRRATASFRPSRSPAPEPTRLVSRSGFHVRVYRRLFVSQFPGLLRTARSRPPQYLPKGRGELGGPAVCFRFPVTFSPLDSWEQTPRRPTKSETKQTVSSRIYVRYQPQIGQR